MNGARMNVLRNSVKTNRNRRKRVVSASPPDLSACRLGFAALAIAPVSLGAPTGSSFPFASPLPIRPPGRGDGWMADAWAAIEGTERRALKDLFAAEADRLGALGVGEGGTLL